MANIKVNRLVLDVLKPHQPDVLEFARVVASQIEESNVELKVLEMDEKTETLEVVVEGPDLELDKIVAAINSLGASLHSIDGVKVTHLADPNN